MAIHVLFLPSGARTYRKFYIYYVFKQHRDLLSLKRFYELGGYIFVVLTICVPTIFVDMKQLLLFKYPDLILTLITLIPNKESMV